MNTATKSPAKKSVDKSGAKAIPAPGPAAAPSAMPGEARAGARPAPSHEAIARRAYALYLQRGGAEGNPLDDWFRAERELTS